MAGYAFGQPALPGRGIAAYFRECSAWLAALAGADECGSRDELLEPTAFGSLIDVCAVVDGGVGAVCTGCVDSACAVGVVCAVSTCTAAWEEVLA